MLIIIVVITIILINKISNHLKISANGVRDPLSALCLFVAERQIGLNKGDLDIMITMTMTTMMTMIMMMVMLSTKITTATCFNMKTKVPLDAIDAQRMMRKAAI